MTKMKELKIVDGSEFFTVNEAAKILEVQPSSIRHYIMWKQMTAYKFKTLTLISKEEIERWKGVQK
jgi:excisionase family DNA binding protein